MAPPLSVVIENWQATNILETWIPIAIGVLALITSSFSVWFTVKIYRQSSRPFITAINYCIESENGLINQNEVILFIVYNSPAKVFSYSLILSKKTNGQEVIITQIDTGLSIHYPDENIKWWGYLSEDELRKCIHSLDSKSELFRHVKIHYACLLGGKKYKYSLKQRYNIIENKWDDVNVYAT